MARRSTTREHHALADEHRMRIVDELERSPEGLDARELARRLALHPNTIRWHLDVLADAGLVSSHPEGKRTRPGRPRVLFTLRADVGAVDRENYRLLAAILAGALAQLDDAPQRAAAAARVRGRRLARSLPRNDAASEGDGTGAVVELLAQAGFPAEAVGDEIRIHRCPFHDIAEAGPELVCSVHRGLIAGALAGLESTLRLERLDAFIQPQLCVARLAPRRTSAAGA